MKKCRHKKSDHFGIKYKWVPFHHNNPETGDYELEIIWCEECGAIKFHGSKQWMKPRREQNVDIQDMW